MAPSRVRRVSTGEVRALLRRADQLMAESNELGEQARTTLRKAFRAQQLDQPVADDRERRSRLSKRGGRKA